MVVRVGGGLGECLRIASSGMVHGFRFDGRSAHFNVESNLQFLNPMTFFVHSFLWTWQNFITFVSKESHLNSTTTIPILRYAGARREAVGRPISNRSPCILQFP